MHTRAQSCPDLEKCNRCLVGHPAICSTVGSEALEELNKIASIRDYPAGSVIIPAGDPAGIVGNVLSGIVKLTKIMPDGRMQVVGLLFPSDFIGRAFSEAWPFSAEAATDVGICAFDRVDFDRLLLATPELEHQLLVATLDELDAARDWMLLLGCKSAEEKVASFLMFVAKRGSPLNPIFNTEGESEFELPISRADMAAYLGTTVETISRQITRLKTRNIIRLTDAHHFVVPDIDRLAAAAGID